MHEHTDLLTDELMFPLKISRSYNHKIISLGVFGNKWCSNLDEKLQFSPAGGIMLKKCGLDTFQVFTKQSDFYANPRGTEIIRTLDKGAGYVRFTKNEIRTYNNLGLIRSISSKNSPAAPFLIFFYNGQNTISKILHNDKQQYIFTYDKTGKFVNRIAGPGKLQINYQYDENNNLVSVTDAWGKRYRYLTDKLNRIVKVEFSDDQAISIDYDSKNFVTKIADSQNCITELNYKTEISNSKLSTQYSNSCTKETKSLSSTQSPVFFKNRVAPEKLKRAPASFPAGGLSLKPGWKSLEASDTNWEYLENNDGNIIQINEINRQTNSKRTLRASYNQQRLKQLTLDNQGAINFKYDSEGKTMMSSLTKSKETIQTFKVFSRFLKNKAENSL